MTVNRDQNLRRGHPLPQDWQLDLGRSTPDPKKAPGWWLRRYVGENWVIHVRLITDGHRTQIEELQIRPTRLSRVAAIRGRLDLPTGNPADPEWHRISLNTALRDATAALRHELKANPPRQPPPPSPPTPARGLIDRGANIYDTIGIRLDPRGFTPDITRPRRDSQPISRNHRLALVALAYHAALDAAKPPRIAVHGWLADLDLHYTLGSVAQLIRKAREAEMLTSPGPGITGGTPTDKAYQAIAESGLARPFPWEPQDQA